MWSPRHSGRVEDLATQVRTRLRTVAMEACGLLLAVGSVLATVADCKKVFPVNMPVFGGSARHTCGSGLGVKVLDVEPPVTIRQIGKSPFAVGAERSLASSKDVVN